MGLKSYFTNRKNLSILLISLILFFCFIVIFISLHNKIRDDIVPLSGSNIEAMFYVEESGGVTCIGDGFINSTQEVSHNSTAASSKVVSSPDYSAIIGNDYIIIWHTITKVDDEYQVIGKIASASSQSAMVSNVEDLMNSSFAVGTTISTKGFYTSNDGGAAEYVVAAKPLSVKVTNVSIPLANGLYANLVYTDSINARQIGARGDGTSDDYNFINSIIRAGINLYLPKGDYFCSTRIVISKDIELIGESKTESIITFRDTVTKASYESWNQRGLITFNYNSLKLENIGFQYIADNTAPFTRTKTQASGTAAEGVLFSILRGSSIIVNDCYFYVGGDMSPAVSCLWMKAEQVNIRNVKVTNCRFINNSESTVGGCLWFSSHDNPKISVSNVTITHNYFAKQNNDEALSFWGYNVNNVVAEENEFEYYGKNVQNDIMVAFGMPNSTREETITDMHFRNNKFNIDGVVVNVIKAQLLTPQSDIEISGNVINANLTKKVVFACFGVNEGGHITLKNNEATINGGNELSYMIYGGGVVRGSGNKFTTKNCTRTMLIKSNNAKYFEDADVEFTNDKFYFAGTTTVSEQAVIQYPGSGSLKLNKCVFDTSNCAIHEMRYQVLYNSDNEYEPNTIEFTDCTLDGTLIFRLNSHSSTELDLSDSTVKGLSFITPKNTQVLSNLDLSGTTYDKLKLNYKTTTSKSLVDITDSINH